MKKMHIALFFSLNFKAPHNNKKVIVAPMTLLEDLATGLHAKGHSVYFLTTKDSQDKPYYYRTPLFISTARNPQIQKLAHQGNTGEHIKLAAFYNQCAVKEFLKKHGKKLDIFNFHSIQYPLSLLYLNRYSFKSIFTLHDSSLNYYQKWVDLTRDLAIETRFSFISKKQAQLINVPKKNVVYHGIKLNDYPFQRDADDYLAFSGRMIPEKGALSAIRVAKKLKKHIQLAGSIPESQDEASYWYNKVKPSLNHGAKYLGLIPYNKMYTLYSRAKALLVPITWNEAFGLVMIEAMACGTPVIAFKHGSVPEVIKDKKTGFIVKNESQMIKAVKKIYDMPQNEYMQMRRNCRKHVEENFSVERMVNDYEKLYYKIVKSNR